MDADSLLASLFVGLVGMALLFYGRRQHRIPHIAAGIAIILCASFVSNVALMLAIAGALGGLLVLAVKLGM